ncbi:MAG: fibronectin type III domain-containing protein, partial [Actinobacteria bacterium]|nr:fibronectin type III domain-containing protein [Actinomycetota bacterium]
MKASVVAVLTLSLFAVGVPAAHAAVPEKPSTVRQVRLDPEHVLLTWKDKSLNEDGFEILRRTIADPNYESRGTVAAGVTQFLDEVPRGTVYIYEVVAFNDDGESDSSNQCYV